MPKHRQTIFVVVRLGSPLTQEALCEAYLSLDAAEEASGRMSQQFNDKGLNGFSFVVRAVSYYDE